jgi:hypothetical protein
MQRIPKGFEIQQIPADGDCMFTAICLACTDLTSAHLREMIVEYLEAHEEEFLPFIIGGDDDVSDFSDYLASVRTHRWGGHLELEVASRVLQRQIQVYTSSGILEFGLSGTCPPVRLSFHEHQLTSNHYNAIVPVLQEESSVA